MWVKSEYAGEIAVLSAWLSVFVPWNIVYHTKATLGSHIFFLRFAFFELQFRMASEVTLNQTQIGGGVRKVDVDAALAQQYPGTRLVGDFFLTTPPTSALGYEAARLQQAGLVWTLAAICFLAAFALSIALYTREGAVQDMLPVNEVRLMGWLLAGGGVGTALASVLYFLERSVVGIPIPVGVVVVSVLAVALLRAEQR